LEDVLAKQVRGLLTVIEQEKIGLVIVDSLGQACGGDINTAESVIRMTNAIRKLGVPVLGIHHSNKQGLPYGSVYIRNHARLMWQAQARPVEGDPMGYVYLDNEKASHVPKQETQYQTVRWANDELYVPQRIRYERTTFDLFPKADEPPTAAPITVSEACLSFLRISAGMKFTPLEVWEQATFAGEVKLDTVERKLRELAEDKQIEKNNARPLRYWVEEDYELPDPY
jgi:hypothetical protein